MRSVPRSISHRSASSDSRSKRSSWMRMLPSVASVPSATTETWPAGQEMSSEVTPSARMTSSRSMGGRSSTLVAGETELLPNGARLLKRRMVPRKMSAMPTKMSAMPMALIRCLGDSSGDLLRESATAATSVSASISGSGEDPRTSSSSDTSKRSARAMRFSVSGSASPRSQRETAWREMPSSLASASCESPRAPRSSTIRVPRSNAMMSLLLSAGPVMASLSSQLRFPPPT